MSPDHPAEASRFITLLHRLEDSILALLLFGMILLALIQIVMRNLFDSGMVWADSLLRIMVLWLGLLGALAATRDNKHIRIDLISRYLSRFTDDIARTLAMLFSAAICAILAWYSFQFVQIEYNAGTKVLTTLPAWLFELILPLTFSLMTLRFIIHCGLSLRNTLQRRQTTQAMDDHVE